MNNLLDLVFPFLRVPLAIGLIGYFPGAMLVRWIFPADGLNRAERFYLSALSSLCLSALTAYGLSRSADGLTPQGLTIWLTAFSLSFLLMGFVKAFTRNRVSPKTETRTVEQLHQTPEPRRRVQSRGFMSVLFGVIFLSSVAAVSFSISNDPVGYGLTEFYVAPQNYENDAVLYTQRGNTVTLPVVIVNQEHKPMTYWLEARVNNNQMKLDPEPFLAHGEIWASDLVVPLSADLNVEHLDLLLFANDSELEVSSTVTHGSEPIAQLRLWLQDESTGMEE